MRIALLGLLFATACSGGSLPNPDASVGNADAEASDALAGMDAAVATVEVGTGITEFNAITDGQVMPLILGPQGGGRMGGYNLSYALRARNVNPRAATTRFKTLLASNRMELAAQERIYNLQPSGGAFIAFGAAPQLNDCCAAENQDLFMTVEVQDTDGKTASDERRVHATMCLDMGGQRICP